MIRPVNGSGMKRMALLNDLSCFGKCSLSVAMPILSSYGVETVPLPTAILSKISINIFHVMSPS